MKRTMKLLTVIVFIAIMVMAGVACSAPGEDSTVEFVFEVTYEDGSSEEFEIATTEEYLADALLEEGLLDESEQESGLYTKINGVAAVWEENEAWWSISKDGEMMSIGMNEAEIADGDHFEAVYMIGM